MPSNKISRKDFLWKGLAATAAVAISGKIIEVAIHSSGIRKIPGSILGAKSKAGHLLRDYKFPLSTAYQKERVVIVGSGISGLSTARWLRKNGFNDFMMLELSDVTGGNAVSGSNEVSKYPWGAHYIPVPDPAMKELIDFLEECGTVTGYDVNGLPVYNEFHLCADPEERLFIQGIWQDGLIPHFGTSETDQKQTAKFFDIVKQFKQETGADNKPAFTIPVDRCSTDARFWALDGITFLEYLKQEGFSSPYLLWYLDYCMRDDFGTNLASISAWAGIHYFAGRKGKSGNAGNADVITWPEGNAFLAGKLKEQTGIAPTINAIAYGLSEYEGQVKLDYYDISSSSSKTILAERVVMATPQFVNQKIISPGLRGELDYTRFSYAPWMVANITVSEMPASHGKPLSWDNVFYQSKSLGYVNACQQHLNGYEKKKVLTYYLPLTDNEPKTERLAVYNRTHEEWAEIIVKDLEHAHKNIAEKIERIDIWIWGHAMIRPLPGFISGTERQKAIKPLSGKIFFAHTDLSGISIFEEGFYHGIRAAEQVIQSLNQNA